MARKSRNKKWRHVYPYVCKGCDTKRIAFDHDRALGRLCRSCEKNAVPEGQETLFKGEIPK